MGVHKKIKTSDNLADVVIHGAEINEAYADYCFVKLPFTDNRAYVLGHLTNCCQSMGGHSEKCVIDGVTRENNGFYVLLKKIHTSEDKNIKISSPLPIVNGKINDAAYEIVGQGYAWLSEGNNLVFDSWENRTPGRDDRVVVDLLKEFSKQVTHAKNSSCIRVLIGNGGKTPSALKSGISVREIMKEGVQYGDSLKQSTIYCNEERRKVLLNKVGLIVLPLLSQEWVNYFHKSCYSELDVEDTKKILLEYKKIDWNLLSLDKELANLTISKLKLIVRERIPLTASILDRVVMHARRGEDVDLEVQLKRDYERYLSYCNEKKIENTIWFQSLVLDSPHTSYDSTYYNHHIKKYIYDPDYAKKIHDKLKKHSLETDEKIINLFGKRPDEKSVDEIISNYLILKDKKLLTPTLLDTIKEYYPRALEKDSRMVSLTEFVNRYIDIESQLTKKRIDKKEDILEYFSKFRSFVQYVGARAGDCEDYRMHFANILHIFSKDIMLEADSLFRKHVLANSCFGSSLNEFVEAYQFMKEKNVTFHLPYQLIFNTPNRSPFQTPMAMARRVVLLKEEKLDNFLSCKEPPILSFGISSDKFLAMVERIKYLNIFLQNLRELLLNPPVVVLPTLYIKKRSPSMRAYIKDFIWQVNGFFGFASDSYYGKEYDSKYVLSMLVTFCKTLEKNNDKSTLKRVNEFVKQYDINLSDFKSLSDDELDKLDKSKIPTFKKIDVVAANSVITPEKLTK